jgi:hypothetical protein
VSDKVKRGSLRMKRNAEMVENGTCSSCVSGPVVFLMVFNRSVSAQRAPVWPDAKKSPDLRSRC